MTKIRELFHKIGNLHNKISVGSGVTKMELKSECSVSKPLKIEKTLRKLTQLERHAVEASKILNQLKDVIYDILDPDTGKPKVK
jgi:hypothetical protein